jgi:hypothetical protein
VLGPLQAIEDLIYPGNRVLVLDGDLIQGPVIQAYPSSVFGANKTGAPQGLLLGRMSPFSRRTASWVFSSSFTAGDNR